MPDTSEQSAEFSDDCLRALQLVSRHVDGDLSAAEEQELAACVAGGAAGRGAGRQNAGGPEVGRIVQQFERDARYLKALLASLPVQPVGPQLQQQVLSTVKAGSVNRPRHLRARRLTSAVAAVATVLALLILLRAPAERAVPTAAQAPETRFQNGAQADAFASGADQFGRAAEMNASPAPAELQAIALAQGEDWQILSVRIASDSRDEVLQQIQTLAQAAGLNMQSVAAGAEQELPSFGVLLTSAPAEGQTFVEQVEHSPLVQSAAWDPSEIGQMNRQQLIAAVRASMLNPSRSELHFGEVFLALPGRKEQESSQLARAGAPAPPPLVQSPTDPAAKMSAPGAVTVDVTQVPPIGPAPAAREAAAQVPRLLKESASADTRMAEAAGQQTSPGSVVSVSETGPAAGSSDTRPRRPILVVFELHKPADQQAPCL